jgi:hypothetical protein
MANLCLNVDPRFFCEASFSGSITPKESMPHMSKHHGLWVVDDGNCVMVSNPNEMISIIALVTRVNAYVLEPRNVDERLDLRCREV